MGAPHPISCSICAKTMSILEQPRTRLPSYLPERTIFSQLLHSVQLDIVSINREALLPVHLRPREGQEYWATSFDDIEGIDNAKNDVMELVDTLRNPEKYSLVGARAPTGLLLVSRL